MSIFHVPMVAIEEINVNIGVDTATTIADATNSTVFVAWFEVNNHTTDTPNLTVDIYDGTNTRYLSDDAGSTKNAVAVVSKTGYKFTLGYVIPKGSLLRVTTSAASKCHVHGVLYRAPAN